MSKFRVLVGCEEENNVSGLIFVLRRGGWTPKLCLTEDSFFDELHGQTWTAAILVDSNAMDAQSIVQTYRFSDSRDRDTLFFIATDSPRSLLDANKIPCEGIFPLDANRIFTALRDAVENRQSGRIAPKLT